MQKINSEYLEKIEKMNAHRQELIERGDYFGEIHILLSGKESEGSQGMSSYVHSDVNGLMNGAKVCIDSIIKATSLPAELVVALVMSELKEEGE